MCAGLCTGNPATATSCHSPQRKEDLWKEYSKSTPPPPHKALSLDVERVTANLEALQGLKPGFVQPVLRPLHVRPEALAASVRHPQTVERISLVWPVSGYLTVLVCGSGSKALGHITCPGSPSG